MIPDQCRWYISFEKGIYLLRSVNLVRVELCLETVGMSTVRELECADYIAVILLKTLLELRVYLIFTFSPPLLVDDDGYVTSIPKTLQEVACSQHA